jgi:16S rRNA (cytidine1402-2'-O)-methyltransferase
MPGKLYLIPNLIGDGNPEELLPANVLNIIKSLSYFIVEDIRIARRFLIKAHIESSIDSLTFFTLNEHTSTGDILSFLEPAKDYDIGLISDAGVPSVADPGADIVSLAHSKGIRVIPLVGPSSILLAIMASGMNGQNFAFNGYLPVKRPERIQRIKFFEKRVITENQTQVFIEAPYRNGQLLEDIVNTCLPGTMLGIATDISQETEFIKSQSIFLWREKLPELHKRPAIFMLGKQSNF